MSGPPVPTRYAARSRITGCITVGAVVLIAGVIVATLAWPGEATDLYSGDVEDTGSAIIAGIALAVAGIGQLVLLVGLIGAGVRIGVEAVEPSEAS